MKNSKEVNLSKKHRANYGEGCYDEIVRKGKTYIRFRKTYGYVKKEFTGKTMQEVNKKVAEFESKPILKASISLVKMPLADYIKLSLIEIAKEKRDMTNSLASNNKHSLGRISSYSIGKLPIGRITGKDIEDYMFELVAKPYAKATINKDYFLIKRCLERAKKKNLINANPADAITPIKENEVIKHTKDVVALEIEDMNKLLKEAERLNTKEHQINGPVGTRVYGTNADVVCFLIYTGLRIGECLALRYADVEKRASGETVIHISATLKELPTGNGNLTLQRGTTKTESSKRALVLCEQAVKIIDTQKKLRPNAKAEDYIFVGETGNPILTRNVNRTIKNMAERAQCSKTNISAHVMRHTFASFLVSNDVNVYTVSKLLGHSSIRTTEAVYADLLLNASSNAIECFNKLGNSMTDGKTE